MIVDTHTHFYDPARPQGVPWPSPGEEHLYRTVLPRHYKALAEPEGVTATVVVEASPWVEDNQWILDLAAADPFIVGLVGHLGSRKRGLRPAVGPLWRKSPCFAESAWVRFPRAVSSTRMGAATTLPAWKVTVSSPIWRGWHKGVWPWMSWRVTSTSKAWGR